MSCFLCSKVNVENDNVIINEHNTHNIKNIKVGNENDEEKVTEKEKTHSMPGGVLQSTNNYTQT